jgi:RNA polymerase sigma factor (TIGR02999 family)
MRAAASDYYNHAIAMPEPVVSPRHSRSVTELLASWSAGDPSALTELTPLVHAELYRLAKRQMRCEREGHTLQTSAIVNEAYLRLVDLGRTEWRGRAHFFAMAARLMRHVLVDHARSHGSLKRGGEVELVPLGTMDVSDRWRGDLAALDDALSALARVDQRKSHVVEMRFFGGLTVQETADTLGVSPETVMRDWRIAKAWLLRELRPS